MRKLGLALPPAAAEMFLSRIGINKNGLIGVEAFALAYPDRTGTAESDVMMSTSPISRRAGRKSQNSIDNSKDSPLKTSSSLGGVRSLARAESREASNFEISNKDGSMSSYKHSASNEKKSKGDVLPSASAINKISP